MTLKEAQAKIEKLEARIREQEPVEVVLRSGEPQKLIRLPEAVDMLNSEMLALEKTVAELADHLSPILAPGEFPNRPDLPNSASAIVSTITSHRVHVVTIRGMVESILKRSTL